MSKNNHFIGLNDDAPPAKRLKLELDRAETRDLNNNIESDESQEFGLPSSEFDVRKRKIAVKRPAEKTVLDLHSYAVLEIFEYLPLNDLCNVAQSNRHFVDLARMAFRNRYPHGFRMNTNGRGDIELLMRVLSTFGDMITAAEFATNHRR